MVVLITTPPLLPLPFVSFVSVVVKNSSFVSVLLLPKTVLRNPQDFDILKKEYIK
jgi:hypothetical protein